MVLGLFVDTLHQLNVKNCKLSSNVILDQVGVWAASVCYISGC